ncbi:hypothetical protein [Sapientia aquatica]|uniref:Uncharacterized protein n=1 Tax=Sapientia aquatica TaxID=1549640 RepID=A0A4R5VQ59_9BURK|nr:hypothetical protein [Sapientia aquatica]TDK60455.1 hypothetical protein E2I14_18220 [Sapientia aquatica]
MQSSNRFHSLIKKYVIGVAAAGAICAAHFSAAAATVTYPSVQWAKGSSYSSTSVFNATSNTGYFSDWVASPNQIFQVDLARMTSTSSLTVTGPTYLNAVAYNPGKNTAVYGGYYSNQFAFVNLANFTQTGTLTLNASLNFPGTYSEAYDPTTQMAYFGSNAGKATVKGQIIKIDTSKSAFVSSIPLLAGEAVVNFLMIDPGRQMLYAGIVTGTTKSGTSRLVSINLVTGARVSSLSIPTTYIDWGLIDTGNNIAYVTSYGTATTLYKIDLGSLSIVASTALTSPVISGGVIDLIHNLAFFGSSNNSCNVSTVDLTTFRETGTISMACSPFARGDTSQGIYTQFIDTTNRFVYWGVDTSPGSVIRMPY